MVQVVAAVIEREGRVLIGQRTPAQAHALQWEFPGGKVEDGESPAQALARELEEELGIRGAAGEEITRYPYSYPGRPPALLIFFRVIEFQGEPRNLVFHDLRWERPQILSRYDFLEGDVEFLRSFSNGNFS
jgi:8-oxo-dGTP diphosphatase